MSFFEDYQTEFNSSLETLQRIANIKRMLNSAWYRRDFREIFRLHEVFIFELYPVLTPQERKDISQLRNEVVQILNTSNSKKEEDQTIKNKIYELELKLRDLDQKHGMNMLKKQDARAAMAN